MRLMTLPLLYFMVAMVLANVASHMYQSLLPLYIQSLGAGVGQVGLFFTLGAIAPLAFQILGGWLSDSLGRMQAVAIGSVAGLVGFLVFIFAPSWQWLLISTVTGAVARSFVAPSFQAFVAEQADEDKLGQVYGLTESIFMIVGIVGPPLGGYLVDHFSFQVMFIVAGTLYAGATVLRIFMARGERRRARESDEVAAKPTLGGLKRDLTAMAGMVLGGGLLTWILISDGVRDVAFSLGFQLEPLYMQNIMGLSNMQIGWLSSLSSVMTILLMSPAGWLSDKRGERVGIVGGFAVVALGMVAFLRARTFAGFAVSWALFGTGWALIGPAYNSLISKAVPQKLRGTAFGLFSTSIGFISLPAPYIGAALWERFNPQVPFYMPLVATVALLPIMWVKFRLPDAREERRALPEGVAVVGAD
jgi:MFS family permease